ncbi:MAG TPA: gamma-glutamyl-gamma-aminobutyrate hydrolase family protein [Gemmatimonadaceae bacterium]|jgi:putative glutamine amidotransferase
MPSRLVALSSSSKPAAAEGQYARVGVNEAYVRAIQSVGLVPLIVPPSLSPDAAASVVAQVAGVVLSGGEDVDPACYGVERHPLTQDAHAGRDATEIALVHAARRAKRPVLGICRGLQLFNIALGGTLVQDLASERPSDIVHPREAARTQRVHAVEIVEGTRLARATGARRIDVNTLHHQAVDRLASGLRVTALATDGVIEACETTDDWWVIAVQWHPEELIDDQAPWDRAIFEAFATACATDGATA